MAHRPYPNRERALRQVRRRPVPGPTAVPHWSENLAAVVGMSGMEAVELLRRWRAASSPPVDEYRLSTR